jgi:hypothetical protein
MKDYEIKITELENCHIKIRELNLKPEKITPIVSFGINMLVIYIVELAACNIIKGRYQCHVLCVSNATIMVY